MEIFLKIFSLLLFSTATVLAQQNVPAVAVEPGVSLDLARSRSSGIKDLEYHLHFKIPVSKIDDIKGSEKINFKLSAVPALLQLDFKQSPAHIQQVLVNGKNIAIKLIGEHLLIESGSLDTGSNEIDIEFTAGNESLNRNNDYLYALFVPDRARTTFPCFDQPDLKANFNLTLTVPADWKVLANGRKRDSILKNGELTYRFARTEPLPTYLFSFAAGKFTKLERIMSGQKMQFLHRETDSSKIRLSVDSVFIAHQEAINFLQNWTSIAYPFQQIGFVAIPDFQFGGMEHPGEIQYKSSSLFLGEGSTKEQFIARSNLISHEIAHMWFGDLVTMKWFDDVWMKEVFANFIADKVTEELMGEQTFNLKFLQDHFPAAYSVDRTQGANPIRQKLTNLNEAGSMYGNIIYHKAPLMMRQLEQLMGPAKFQKGIQEYLRTYAYRNASWDDLIAILSKYSETNLRDWNQIWVNQPGRPIFNYKIKYNGNKIKNFTISQQPEMGKKRFWPQKFSITLVYPDSSKNITVAIKGKSLQLDTLKGMDKPAYIHFNSDGQGYGLFPIDQQSMNQVLTAKEPVTRAAAYINAYENALAGHGFKPAELLKLFGNGLATEQNEMNLKLLSGYVSRLYWTFISPEERLAYSATLEHILWKCMEQQAMPNLKKTLFSCYQDIYLSEDAGKKVYEIWHKTLPPNGVNLNEDDYTALALTIALKTDSGTKVLKQQADRISNSDRKDRLHFLMPALSGKVADRDQFFLNLRDIKNRRKESWVNLALAYLHHPLRQYSSEKYLEQSLELLAQIQQTGDIFFPQSWLSASFGSYQNKKAFELVENFLKKRPNYNANLKGKILQATDNLHRAQKLLGK